MLQAYFTNKYNYNYSPQVYFLHSSYLSISIMKFYTILLFASLLFLATPSYAQKSWSRDGGGSSSSGVSLGSSSGSEDLTAIEQEIFRLVNKYRANRGLKQLEWFGSVAAVCRRHSAKMASKKVKVGHDGFDKRQKEISDQIDMNSMAENVATGKGVSQDFIVEQWSNSPMHKANMEGDYTNTGIGVARGKDGTLYYTQIFLK
jgi:uncharacterized protein YkwD